MYLILTRSFYSSTTSISSVRVDSSSQKDTKYGVPSGQQYDKHTPSRHNIYSHAITLGYEAQRTYTSYHDMERVYSITSNKLLLFSNTTLNRSFYSSASRTPSIRAYSNTAQQLSDFRNHPLSRSIGWHIDSVTYNHSLERISQILSTVPCRKVRTWGSTHFAVVDGTVVRVTRLS